MSENREPGDGRCENCRWWDMSTSGHAHPDHSVCRAGLPTPAIGTCEAVWPLTAPDDWCRYHEPSRPLHPMAERDEFFAARLFGRPGDEVFEYEDPGEIAGEDAEWLAPAPVMNDQGEQRWAVMVPTSEDGDSEFEWFATAEEAQRFCDDWPREAEDMKG